MNSTTHAAYIAYIRDGTPPTHVSPHNMPEFLRNAGRYVVHDNVLYLPAPGRRCPEGVLRVPIYPQIFDILRLSHNLAGHQGAEATIRRVRQTYYWPSLEDDVRSYVRGCRECQLRAPPRYVEPLHSIPVDSPFHRVGIDLVGQLPHESAPNSDQPAARPPSHPFRYLFVATDYLTKWVVAQPIRDKRASTIAHVIYTRIICIFGCPHFILTDGGSEFCNQLNREVCLRLGIERQVSSPHHPRTNGLTERVNRTLCESLARYVLEMNNPYSWPDHVPAVVFAYNTNRQRSTGMTPAELLYGFQPRMPADLAVPQYEQNDRPFDSRRSIVARAARLHRLYGLVPATRARIATVQAKQRQDFNSRRHSSSHDTEFSIGHRVWLLKPDYDGDKLAKFDAKWDGPWMVIDNLGNGTYKIARRGTSEHRLAHRDRLRRCYSAPARNADESLEDESTLEGGMSCQ